ncbi:MAG: hypothetical protein JKX76_01785 [Colwellia sp.]|nr:hypothetical protein [Colwellia sp.]
MKNFLKEMVHLKNKIMKKQIGIGHFMTVKCDSNGNKKIINKIREYMGGLYNEKGMLKCVRNGNIGGIKLLRIFKVDFGNTLKHAILLDRMRIAKFLIINGAKIDQKNKSDCLRLKILPYIKRYECISQYSPKISNEQVNFTKCHKETPDMRN